MGCFILKINLSSFVVPSPLCSMLWVQSIIHIWDLKPKKLSSFPLTLFILFPTNLSGEKLFPNQIFPCSTSPVGCRTFQIPRNLWRLYFVSTGSLFSLFFWKIEQKKRSYKKEMGNEVYTNFSLVSEGKIQTPIPPPIRNTLSACFKYIVLIILFFKQIPWLGGGSCITMLCGLVGIQVVLAPGVCGEAISHTDMLQWRSHYMRARSMTCHVPW